MLLNDGKSNTHKSLTFDLYEQKERERGKRRKKGEEENEIGHSNWINASLKI